MKQEPRRYFADSDEWREWYRLTPRERWRETSKLWAFYLQAGGSLDPEPIHKVLSTLRSHRVRCLLMGGQACVLYGAAEFSRDTDLVLLAESGNLRRLRTALRALQAELIAVPNLDLRHLRRGQAVHFRCQAPGVAGLRIEI